MKRALASLALVLAGCQSGPGPKVVAPPPVAVTVGRCERQTVVRQVQLPGDVKAFREAQLYARVSGYLDSITVDRGDRVVEGQLLARVRLPEAEREQAQVQAVRARSLAELEAARGRLTRAQTERTTAMADYRRSQAQRQQLAAELARARSLEQQALAERRLAEANRARLMAIAAEDSGLVAAQDLDVSRTSVEVAQQKWRSSHSTVLSASQSLAAGGEAVEAARTRVEASSDQIGIAQAQLESSGFQSEADTQLVEKTQALLSYTEIRAPFTGVITGRWLDPGALIQSSAGNAQQNPRAVLAIADFDRVRVRVEPPQDVATAIERGTPAVITAQGVEGEIRATISRTSGVLDPTARTMVAELDVPNPKHLLRPGMFVQVALEAARHRNVLAIPAEALVVERHARVVFVCEGGKAHRTVIETGIEGRDWVEVRSGLKEGDSVITSNPARLTDGTAVQP